MDFITKKKDPNQDFGTSQAVEHGASGGHGGAFATALSAIALFFSGLSYYDSTLASADLTVYVPPMVHYARDGADVFNVPITIVNNGAQNGTVLSMDLNVENLDPAADRKSILLRSMFLGDYPRDENAPLRSFAPLSVRGGGTVTETVRFYNMGEQMPLLVTDKGTFRFTLTLNVARSQGLLDSYLRRGDPKPLTFDLELPYFPVHHVANRNGTIAMYNKTWSSAMSQPAPQQ